MPVVGAACALATGIRAASSDAARMTSFIVVLLLWGGCGGGGGLLGGAFGGGGVGGGGGGTRHVRPRVTAPRVSGRGPRPWAAARDPDVASEDRCGLRAACARGVVQTPSPGPAALRAPARAHGGLEGPPQGLGAGRPRCVAQRHRLQASRAQKALVVREHAVAVAVERRLALAHAVRPG